MKSYDELLRQTRMTAMLAFASLLYNLITVIAMITDLIQGGPREGRGAVIFLLCFFGFMFTVCMIGAAYEWRTARRRA